MCHNPNAWPANQLQRRIFPVYFDMAGMGGDERRFLLIPPLPFRLPWTDSFPRDYLHRSSIAGRLQTIVPAAHSAPGKEKGP